MTASLDGLPPELLTCIAEVVLDDESLQSHELLQLRSTCRTIEAAIRRTWVRAYFAVRSITMDSAKITELKQVVAVPEFASVTKELCIDCDKAELSAESLMQISSPLSIALRPLQNVETITFGPPPDFSYDELHSNGIMDIDFSDAFSIVLFAAQACGIQPQCIGVNTEDCQAFDANMRITNCRSMRLLPDCFTRLATIKLLVEVDEEIETLVDLATDLAGGLNLMQCLTRLSIDFPTPPSSLELAIFFTELVDRVHLPSIMEIHVRSLFCLVSALTRLLIMHTTTLTKVKLRTITSVHDDGLESFRNMPREMQDSLRLETLEMEELFVSDTLRLDFPHYTKIYSRESDGT